MNVKSRLDAVMLLKMMEETAVGPKSKRTSQCKLDKHKKFRKKKRNKAARKSRKLNRR